MVATNTAPTRWYFVVDTRNIPHSTALVRDVASRPGCPDDLGVKGQTGVLASRPSRAAFLHDPSHAIVLHDTPKRRSWLNQVAIWRSILTRKLLRRGPCTSVEGLQATVPAFIAYDNRTMTKPCKWITHYFEW